MIGIKPFVPGYIFRLELTFKSSVWLNFTKHQSQIYSKINHSQYYEIIMIYFIFDFKKLHLKIIIQIFKLWFLLKSTHEILMKCFTSGLQWSTVWTGSCNEQRTTEGPSHALRPAMGGQYLSVLADSPEIVIWMAKNCQKLDIFFKNLTFFSKKCQ